jgi:beta-aspartyl-peptidase (threonine type)
VLTKRACDELRAGASPNQAAQCALTELSRVGGLGGLILVDRTGRLGLAFTAERMARAAVLGSGAEISGFYPDGGNGTHLT